MKVLLATTKSFMLMVALHAVMAHGLEQAPEQKPQPAPYFRLDPGRFPLRGIIADQVVFWQRIFGEFPSTTIVIHDTEAPHLLVDIVDFQQLGLLAQPKYLASVQRQKFANTYLERYQLALRRFASEGIAARRHGKIEERVMDIYRSDRDAFKRLMRGEVTLRTQTGLADTFLEAVRRAAGYLPYMEDEFIRNRVPPQITRLAFVESMFNLDARSKVGASGIWQFMPSTGKLFLRINQDVDERNSPYLATAAAARLLRKNYDALGSWPLAITAYNHGRGGMQSAVSKVGSDRLSVIVQRYRSPSFGFASKNFYAEFYAAASIYNRIIRQHQELRFRTPHRVHAYKLVASTSISKLLRMFGVSLPELKRFNPHLKALDRRNPRLGQLLTRATTLFLPKALGGNGKGMVLPESRFAALKSLAPEVGP